MKTLIISLTFLGILFAQQNKIDSLESLIKQDSQNIEAMFELAKIYHDMLREIDGVSIIEFLCLFVGCSIEECVDIRMECVVAHTLRPNIRSSPKRVTLG